MPDFAPDDESGSIEPNIAHLSKEYNSIFQRKESVQNIFLFKLKMIISPEN